MSHVYNYIKFIMSIYNTSQKNKAVIRSDKAYFDDGAYVWDESINDWVSLAESNQVLSYSYLKNNSVQMTASAEPTTTNELSPAHLTFSSTTGKVSDTSLLTSDNLVISSGGDSNTLTANTTALVDDSNNTLNMSAGAINLNNTSSDTNPSLKLTYQGIKATSTKDGTTQLSSGGLVVKDNQSDVLNLSPAEINLTNGSKQAMDITPVQISITGADNTNVDLQSSFIKINNSSGTTVANLSQSGLVLSNGTSSTTLTPTSLDGSAITCSTINCTGGVIGGGFEVSGGTSKFSTDELNLTLTNSVDNSNCTIQSSSVVLSNKNKNTNLTLDGSSLVKADIDKLHNLPSTIPSYPSPTTYYDSTNYNMNPYNPGTGISDLTQFYYKPSSGTQFNVGDLIQCSATSTIVGGTTQFAYLRIYLPQNNEFLITGQSKTPTTLYTAGLISGSDDLNYPMLTVRGPSSGFTTENVNITIGSNTVAYRPYFLIFNANGLTKNNNLPVSYTINIQCIGNVCASSNGTSISHNV